MAQLVEHILGKDEVIGSTPISSSIFFWRGIEAVITRRS